jgi:hypothetical protein
MAIITFPRDILATFPGVSTKFDLFYRQSRSRSAGGTTYSKDFGTPIWKATYQSRIMRPNELSKWKAIIKSLDGGLNAFKGRDMVRRYPIAYPRGSWPTGGAFSGSATLAVVGSSNKDIDISGLPAGFKFSTGDMLQIGTTDLHQVMADVTASGAGYATGVELRPHLWPGVVAGRTVLVKDPACVMIPDPDTINTDAEETQGIGRVSFDAWEFR